MDYLFVLMGLSCLFFGGDWLVRGAIALSGKLGLPAFLISLTVVGFGTSLPELLVSVRAALADAPGVALGNVVGSNIANILLIIGVASLISPLRQPSSRSYRDISVMMLASIVLFVMLHVGAIGMLFGVMLVTGLIAYLLLAYIQDKGQQVDLEIEQKTGSAIAAMIIGGLVALGIGADLLVRGASNIAFNFGVSEAVIGLTVVAVGTSLPELATSISAAIKRQADVAIGNVIGSNIFNILGILGITAIISPISVADRFASVDGWVLLAATTILSASLLLRVTLSWFVGAVFLGAYTAYMLTMA